MNGIELQKDFYQLYLSNLNRYLQEPPFTIATLFSKNAQGCHATRQKTEEKGKGVGTALLRLPLIPHRRYTPAFFTLLN